MCSSAVDTAHISSQSLSSVTNMDPFCGFIIFIQQARIWIILKSMNLLRFSLFPGRIHTNTHKHAHTHTHSRHLSASQPIAPHTLTHSLTSPPNPISNPFLSCLTPGFVSLTIDNINLRICKSPTKWKTVVCWSIRHSWLIYNRRKKNSISTKCTDNAGKKRKTKEKGKTQKKHRNKRNIRHFRR